MAEEIIQENFLPEAQGVYGDPEPKPKSYLKKIHENLIEAYGKDQVPDEAAFTAKMKDTAYARLIHENLVDAFGENEVPDLKLFNSKLINDGDVKKKDGTKVLGFSPYDFLNVGKPSSRTQLPLVGEYSQVQESKAAPKAKESSKDAIQNLLGFIKSGGKPTKGGGKTNQVAKSTQPTVSQNVREQAALGRLGKALVDPVTGTKIDRKTGLPSAYVNELNKKSTFSAPQISEEDKSIYLQSLGLNPNATDVEVLNTPDFRQFKQTVEQEKKINQAIDNYWKRQDAIDMQKRAGFSGPFVSSRTSALGFDEDLRKRLKSGDLVITNDEVTGEPIIGKPDYNPITSFLNLYNKSYDQKAEEKYTQNLSAADKIKNKEAKQYLASLNNEIPSVPSGFFGKLGATAGSFAQALAEPTMTGIGLYATGGMIGAPALGTEAAFTAAKGLQSVGDVVGWMNEIGNDSYEPTWDKVYNGNLQNIENPTYQQKIDAANKATEAASYAKSVGALEGMFFGIPLGSLGSSIKPSVTGYLNTLKSIGRSSLAQMPQMTGASFLGQVGKGEVGRQFGSNETHSQIIQQGLENAWETAKFVGGMGFVHAAQASIPHAFALLTNKAESPSKALTSKAKAIVSKFPEDVVADVYAKAEQEGVIPPGKANEILTDLQSYKESEAQVPKTVVDVDARDAIAGKIQKRDKLDQELKETKVNARKEEIKQEIAQIDAEIDNIYKGDDVLANEYDINGIPLNQDLPAPKQRPSIIPLENVEAVPAEKLLTEEVKPTEVKAEVKPTEVEVTEEVKPIRQLGTGSNVYFENNKYRVNDISKGKVILNIEGKEEGGMAIANIEFDNPKEAVEVAKELSKIYPKGIPDAVLIDKVVDNIRNRIKEGIKAEVKPTEVKKEVFKSSQGNTVELENGKLVVKSKSGEVLSERASKKATEEYADNLDYSKGEKAPELPSEIVDPKQASQYVIEESKNPLEIAQAYIAEGRLPSEGNTKFQAIAEYGLGRVTTDSYKRFGDVNKMEPATKLRYLTKEGFTVDQRAEEISGKTGLDITPQDIIDYIDKYPKGDYKVMTEVETNVALQAKDKFNKLTGLDLTPELANKIIDKELQKANKNQLDIIKEDYETAKQLEDAYWAEYKKTDGFTKESNIGEVNKPEAAPKPEKSLEKAYKDLTNIEKRQIINSKFDKLLEELKIEKICPTD